MAHAYYHAKSSAKRFGGTLEDYLHLHEWMDHTKAHIADARHRLLLHNSWGIFIGEQVYGTVLTRQSDGHAVPVRAILERHVIEDLGFIPSVEQCLQGVPNEHWMYRNAKPLSQEEQKQEDPPCIPIEEEAILELETHLRGQASSSSNSSSREESLSHVR